MGLGDKTPKMGATPDRANRAISKRPTSLKEAKIKNRLGSNLIDQSDSEDAYREDTSQTPDTVLHGNSSCIINLRTASLLRARLNHFRHFPISGAYVLVPGVPVARVPVHLGGLRDPPWLIIRIVSVPTFVVTKDYLAW